MTKALVSSLPIVLTLVIVIGSGIGGEQDTEDVIIDFFEGDQLIEWRGKAYYFENMKYNVASEDKQDAIKLSLTKNKEYFKEGDGALRIEFSESKINESKPFAEVRKEHFINNPDFKNDCLVLWIYNAGGAGRFKINMYNSRQIKKPITITAMDIKGPGLSQVIIKKKRMKGSVEYLNSMNRLIFYCFGEFVIYVSGIKLTKERNIKLFKPIKEKDYKPEITVPSYDISEKYD